ncbi:DNA oxidative demethylase ALKBH2 [Diplonema papillatum]|nr:DNA oxidative demethylase ALKBH2 [Diplonema papillatum]|eukprot:gene16759-25724_t
MPGATVHQLGAALGRRSWVEVYRAVCRSTARDVSEIWAAHCPPKLAEVEKGGRVLELPRYQKGFGLKRYSVVRSEFEAMPSEVVRVKTTAEAASGREYDMCLLNFYEHGNHYCPSHSDCTRELAPGSAIACLSWGAARRMVISPKRQYVPACTRLDLWLEDGDLVVMCGDTQATHAHSITKDPTSTAPRVSFTFRKYRWGARRTRSRDPADNGKIQLETSIAVG